MTAIATKLVLKQVQRRAGLLFGLALLIPVISLMSSMVLELVPGSQTNALLDVGRVVAGAR
jgi:hypothetical protein